MLSLTDRASIRAAARDPTLDPALRAVLTLRYEQLGGVDADFHICGLADDVAAAEAAVGWPMTLDGAPCWEWTDLHCGHWREVVFVLSDDGPAQVLLAPAGSPIADLVDVHESQSTGI